MHKFCDHPFSLTAPSILCKVIKNPSKTIFHKFYSFMFTHTQRTIPTFQQSRAQDICEWNDDFLGALWWGHWRFASDSGGQWRIEIQIWWRLTSRNIFDFQFSSSSLIRLKKLLKKNPIESVKKTKNRLAMFSENFYGFLLHSCIIAVDEKSMQKDAKKTPFFPLTFFLRNPLVLR